MAKLSTNFLAADSTVAVAAGNICVIIVSDMHDRKRGREREAERQRTERPGAVDDGHGRSEVKPKERAPYLSSKGS